MGEKRELFELEPIPIGRHAELVEASLPLRCNGPDEAVEMLRLRSA